MNRLGKTIVGLMVLGWLGQAALSQPPPDTMPPPPVPEAAPAGEGPMPQTTDNEPRISSTTDIKPVETKPETKVKSEGKPAEGKTRVLFESTRVVSGGGLLGFLSAPMGGHCGGLCGLGGGRWTLGGGIYYFQPRWETNPAFRLSSGTATTDRQFNYDYRVAPLAFLGYEWESGFGIRGRWFQLNASAGESFTGDGTTTLTSPTPLGLGLGTVTPTAGTLATANSSLKLYAYDVEATQTFQHGLWSLLVAGGARYGRIQQSYDGSATTAGATTNVHGEHTLSGIGPTFAIEARRALGHSGFALYGNARGSILFGNNNESANTSSGGVTTATATTSNRDVLPIGELEVGAEYGRDWGKVRLFGQVGFVGQTWFGAGNSSNVDSAFTGGGPDNHSNLGLIGVAFRAGINF